MDSAEYHKLAAVEDSMWYFRALHRHIERELVSALGDRVAAILDAGCGTGGLIRRLASSHSPWTWTGLDVAPLAVRLARERTRGIATITEGGVTALPFQAATFDAVVSADVLYHVEDDLAALRESYRVLKPGGVLVVNVPAYRWLWSYHDEAVHSRRRYDRRELREKLRAVGFVAPSITYWNTLPFPLVVARRKFWPAHSGGSDVHVFPRPLERLFDVAMSTERAWLRTIGALPFGTSVFAVARKN